jgi:hypothetical protein
MNYPYTAIPEHEIPRATVGTFQHLLDTYASETNKVVSVWLAFETQDLVFRPHEKSSSVEDIMKHQLLSERRFFGGFLRAPEAAPEGVLSELHTPADYAGRLVELARLRLAYLAPKTESWWLETVPFFDVARRRVWIF